jgi:predicted DsbA family dithiol-disulfide isomerase
MSAPLISIDIVSDLVCPWCYIGKRKLEAALAASPDLNAHMRWRPFQLDPTIPEEGHDRRAYLEWKFGAARVDEILARIGAAAAEVGLDFAFDKIRRYPNTLDAHRLVRAAKIAGRQTIVVERLFKAYFLDGRDIGNRGELVELGVEAGLERASVQNMYGGREDIAWVKEELATTHRLGVTSVPFYIFGDDIVVPGAQSTEIFAAALARAAAAPSLA